MCNIVAGSGIDQASPNLGFLKLLNLPVQLADVDHSSDLSRFFLNILCLLSFLYLEQLMGE